MLPSWFKPSVDNSGYWEVELGQHQWGEFSMAAIKSNLVAEGHSQLESGSMRLHPSGYYGTFVGLYDGHGGSNASEFIRDHLFEIVKELASNGGEMSVGVLDLSFLALDQQYRQLVEKEGEALPNLLSAGSSCLVGVVIGGRVYVAYVGGSRAVLGRLVRPKRHVPLVLKRVARSKRQAIPLSTGQSANLPSVPQELETPHPRDHSILRNNDYSWRVMGLIRKKRSIGNIPEFNRRPIMSERSRVEQPFNKLIILKEPALVNHELLPEDEFIIFGSPGLWKHLSNEAAVDKVKNSRRKGIAKKLLKKALKKGAWDDHKLKYKKLKKLNITERRSIHDDISVVVLFLDHKLISSGRCNHLSVISYDASSSQPRADGDSSSSTDGASGKQPLTYVASTSQSYTGEASTSQPYIDVASTSQTRTAGASTSQPYTGEASTSQTRTAGTSTSQPHTGEASTSQPRTGEASTSQPYIDVASTSQTRTAGASTSQPYIDVASTSQTRTAGASTSQPHTDVASTSQPRTGEASTSQPQTGEASTSQPHTDEASTSQTRTAGASFSKFKTWPGFSRRYGT
ncbi:protein-serine/threonine phosphatase [Salvia divinorum]|uniref:protein-serine/threonine phosphatase n=1 Tax=Salvia divinorum TaxID=28513 RepID=A0ABD1GHN2_SALDI